MNFQGKVQGVKKYKWTRRQVLYEAVSCGNIPWSNIGYLDIIARNIHYYNFKSQKEECNIIHMIWAFECIPPLLNIASSHARMRWRQAELAHIWVS